MGHQINSGRGARYGTDFGMSGLNDSTKFKKLTLLTTGFGWITRLAEFDSIRHHVKKGKRGACKQKAATVLPNRTAAT